jgi:hypothetical protein
VYSTEIALSKIIAVVERFQSMGVLKVEITNPSDDLAVEVLQIPRLKTVSGLIAVDKNGVAL